MVPMALQVEYCLSVNYKILKSTYCGQRTAERFLLFRFFIVPHIGFLLTKQFLTTTLHPIYHVREHQLNHDFMSYFMPTQHFITFDTLFNNFCSMRSAEKSLFFKSSTNSLESIHKTMIFAYFFRSGLFLSCENS